MEIEKRIQGAIDFTKIDQLVKKLKKELGIPKLPRRNIICSKCFAVFAGEAKGKIPILWQLHAGVFRDILYTLEPQRCPGCESELSHLILAKEFSIALEKDVLESFTLSNENPEK